MGAGNYWNIGALGLQPDQPVTIVHQASGTGTGTSQSFAVLARPDGSAPELWLALGSSSGLSALTGTVQLSTDGGATWYTLESGVDVFAGPKLVSPKPPPGVILRFEVTSFTGTAGDVVAIQA